VPVRENEAGEVAIRYRNQRLVFRELKARFYSAERGEGRCPFPRAPSPSPKSCLPSAHHPWTKKTLSTDEDARFFFGMVKPQPGDISIVDKPGTFLLWYDTRGQARLSARSCSDKLTAFVGPERE
jgi:hypothetical protein